jgi:thiol:disulfide interchange protein
MKSIIYILFISLFIVSCGSGKITDESSTASKKEPKDLIRYERSEELSTVLDKAKSQKKIVLLDMYADWCLPCKLMDEEVFTDKGTADFMNKNFINYKVNGEEREGPDLTLIYNVDAYPTFLFLDYRGRVIKRHVGGLGLQKFNTLMEEVLAMPKTWL